MLPTTLTSPVTRWNVAPSDPAAAADLGSRLGVSPLIGQLLLNRSIGDQREAERFLNPRFEDLPDPLTLPDVSLAIDRLSAAIEAKEKIFVHGDYDADGVTSTALCLRALAGLGADVVGFVPNRADGYDLQKYGVDRAKACGATLILTADCGSSAVEPIAYARSLDIDVIITDHHRPGRHRPDALAIVNPFRDDCDTPAEFRVLCGAGVAFTLLDALVYRLAPQHQAAFRNNFVDLVALGTVADMTPLLGENRILVSNGLRVLGEGKKVGLRALLESVNLAGKTIDASNIGWSLAPRLNAAGRMDDADLAYRLLITRDPAEADALAAQLDTLVLMSREETARVTTEAMQIALSPKHEGLRVLVIENEGWGKGVIGIAAGRLVEQCRRPVILLAYDAGTDTYHGSARTFGAFSVHLALGECADLLDRFGGHSAAAGLSLAASNLDAFRARMHDLAAGFVSDADLVPTLEIDAEIDEARTIDSNFVAQLARLAPFGLGNPEPLFLTRGAVVLYARRAGKDNNTCQLTVRLPGSTDPFKGVAFRSGAWADALSMGDEIDLVYVPVFNEYQGRKSIQLAVKDLRAAGSSTPLVGE